MKRDSEMDTKDRDRKLNRQETVPEILETEKNIQETMKETAETVRKTERQRERKNRH